jgi:DNA-directed RNA polymerase specialized sigma54-like protein
VIVSESFHDSLISQLRLRDLSTEELDLATYLVGTIDDDGLLRRELIDIVDDLAFSQGVFTEEKGIGTATSASFRTWIHLGSGVAIYASV